VINRVYHTDHPASVIGTLHIAITDVVAAEVGS